MNHFAIQKSMILVLFMSYTIHSAEAHRLRMHHEAAHGFSNACVLTNEGRQLCGPSYSIQRSPELDANGSRVANASSEAGTIIGARPSDCPHAYCGCGLRKYLGLSDVRLNLAHNWARLFPHESSPRAGLAAVRNHHVMLIESSGGNGEWIVRDYNSGGGLSRMHARDVRGYVFVNPTANLAQR